MRIVIAGGTGLIGLPLAEELAGAGHEVIVLGRHPERARRSPPGVRVAGWDGKTTQGWGELANGAGAIVNLAGVNLSAGRWTAERKRQIRESRVQAGQAIVAAVSQAAVKPGVVIQASAVGYYGPHGDEVLTEDAPPGNDFLAGIATAWEAASAPVADVGVRRVVMRMGVVLSTRGGALPRMALPYRLFVGGRHGSGQQWLSWIHIRDQVRATRYLIEDERAQGIFNVTSPRPLRNREFLQRLGQALGRPSWFPVPAFAFRLLFGEMSTVLLDGQRVVPQRLEAQGFDFRFPDALGALRDLYQ
jgi:uncharacterized protein (TIGR01777 family)